MSAFGFHNLCLAGFYVLHLAPPLNEVDPGFDEWCDEVLNP